MTRYLLSFLFLFYSFHLMTGQSCEISAVNATPTACTGNYFMVSIDLEVNNPSSPGFTLAGNGTIYGTYLYADLPVTIGPFLGDDESVYEFIAWDVSNGDCQNSTTLPALNCGPICGFSNANLDLVTCMSSNSAIVNFDFDHVNTSNPAFDLFYQNGNQVGSWLYQDLPVTIVGFLVNGAAPITIKVCDHTSSDCCKIFTLDAIDCNPNNCEIFSLQVDPDCINNNFFLAHINFQYDNPASDSFTISGNALNYGTFAYTDLPVTLGPLNGNTNINWTFTIQDSQNPNCQATDVLGVYHCPPPCAIDSLGANAFLCNGDDYYMLQLGMEFEGQGSSGFEVFSASNYYGNHAYNDLPLVIENFSGSGDFVDHVTVCDHDNPQCCATAIYEALLCSDCIIYNLTATPLPCDSSDQFLVIINFNHQNNSDHFTLTGNGNDYGTFAYTDLPVQLGPFNGAVPVGLEFVATDADNALCFDAIELDPVSCADICHVFNLAVETGECSGPDTYVAHINFDHEGMDGMGFDLYINGAFYAFFPYEDLPLTIDQFPSGGTGRDTVTVCANDHPDCCTSLDFDAPVCPCHILEATVQNLDCTSDTTFAIALNFTSENTPDHNINVYLNDIYWGNYNAENLPIIINTIPEGDSTAVLRVCANDVDDCCAEVIIDLMNCVDGLCSIRDLVAEHGDCNSDSTYVLDFSFHYLNLPNDSITVTANGEYIGTYLIDSVFNHIENFPVIESDTIHLLVCGAGAPDCCEEVTYLAPDCSFFGQCHIFNLQAFPGDCQSDSTYTLHFEFNYSNLPGDSIHLTANGNDFGNFPVSDGSIFLQNFPQFAEEMTNLAVCALGNPDCCAQVEFETPGCAGTNDCHIWNLQAIVGDCNTDTTYLLHIEFNFANLPGDSVVITANGNELLHHIIQEGNFTVEHFPVYDTQQTMITICALGAPECCDSLYYTTPDCSGGGACHLYDLVADPGDCTSDSTYNLFIHYFGNNLPSDSVIVIANGNYIGQFMHDPGGILLVNFPVYQTDFTHLRVCAAGAPDCCEDVDFLTPSCGANGNCQINNLVAIIGDCQSDSTYILHLVFNFENLPSDSVQIVANGNEIGHYEVQAGSIFLDQFPVYSTPATLVTVCAIGSPDCCDEIEFETPNCEGGGTCHIFDLTAEAGDCTSDSTFVLFIHYYNNNLPGDSIIVTANDLTIGTYATSPDGLTIDNFPKLSSEITHLQVCAAGAPDCCDSYDFQTPFCTDQCIIYNIQVQVFGCTSDSTFGVVIHFDYQNIATGGFDLYAGDVFLGYYTVDQLPIQTGQFPSNASGHYLVNICENDNTECCATADFNGPTCGENACHILDLTWTMTQCDSNGLFYFILDFQYDHIGDGGFNVFGNGNNYGNFNYAALPITLGPFEANATEYEFLVSDAAHPDCFDSVNPGVVDCSVGTQFIDPDAYFAIFNNGTVPGILAKSNISVSVFNTNGKSVLHDVKVARDAYYEFKNIPNGFYILIVNQGQQTWPVKLISTGY